MHNLSEPKHINTAHNPYKFLISLQTNQFIRVCIGGSGCPSHPIYLLCHFREHSCDGHHIEQGPVTSSQPTRELEKSLLNKIHRKLLSSTRISQIKWHLME